MPARQQSGRLRLREPGGRWLWLGAAMSVVIVLLGLWAYFRTSRLLGHVQQRLPKIVPYVREPDAVVFARYGGSPSCRECHPQAYALWTHSHHGLAERPIDPELDRPAFEPPRRFKHGTQTSEARLTTGRWEIVTAGFGGQRGPYVPQRVIGVDPLLQYLVPHSNGLWQSTEIAWDPARQEWFNVYGEEDRQPGEWGHWTGRGMTWNFMCASCHNTRLRRNYDEATDSYATAMVEPGVGCESCHGPMRDHVVWQQEHRQRGAKDPTLRPLSKDQMLDTCGMCHARRGELTGDFIPGDAFAEHYSLAIVDDTDIYYPDGQVRDENYEYASFLSSRMHLSGVRCIDCHHPHSGKTKLTGNALCMQCHSVPTPPAPKIDPATHSHHKADTPGDKCVDCHMPITHYMQRHPRHDHGFTIPDPFLTKQFGIPNACSRCHTNQTVDWSLDAVNQWYGSRMERPTRMRAQTLARARLGEQAAVPALLQIARQEPIPLWRASAALVLRQWIERSEVRDALKQGLLDREPLVRHMALRALEPMSEVDAETRAATQRLLQDPSRLVRVQAAWNLRRTIDAGSVAGQELLAFLKNGVDHAAGAMQMGVFLNDRGERERALGYFQRAVSWDSNSAPLRDTLAVALSQLGRHSEALKELEAAVRVAPREGIYRFRLGLALNEVGRLDEAVRALEEAVKLDENLATAWYNLGLGYAQQERLPPALHALEQAERLNPRSAQIVHARSTVLTRLGRETEAQAAARRAEELHRQAMSR